MQLFAISQHTKHFGPEIQCQSFFGWFQQNALVHTLKFEAKRRVQAMAKREDD